MIVLAGSVVESAAGTDKIHRAAIADLDCAARIYLNAHFIAARSQTSGCYGKHICKRCAERRPCSRYVEADISARSGSAKDIARDNRGSCDCGLNIDTVLVAAARTTRDVEESQPAVDYVHGS